MAFSYGFYNSKNGDKRYDARQIGEMFDGVIQDGVFASVGNHFMVRASDDGKGVIVGSGRAWFNHTWCKNDSDLYFALPDPDLTGARYDALVLDINSDIQIRENSIKWVIGNPIIGETPIKPDMIHTESHNQYPICYIYRLNNTYTITNKDIDNRYGSSELPIVSGLFSSFNNDLFFTSFKESLNSSLNDIIINTENEINDWLEQIQQLDLDENVLANMLDIVNNMDNKKLNINGKNSDKDYFVLTSNILCADQETLFGSDPNIDDAQNPDALYHKYMPKRIAYSKKMMDSITDPNKVKDFNTVTGIVSGPNSGAVLASGGYIYKKMFTVKAWEQPSFALNYRALHDIDCVFAKSSSDFSICLGASLTAEYDPIIDAVPGVSGIYPEGTALSTGLFKGIYYNIGLFQSMRNDYYPSTSFSLSASHNVRAYNITINDANISNSGLSFPHATKWDEFVNDLNNDPVFYDMYKDTIYKFAIDLDLDKTIFIYGIRNGVYASNVSDDDIRSEKNRDKLYANFNITTPSKYRPGENWTSYVPTNNIFGPDFLKIIDNEAIQEIYDYDKERFILFIDHLNSILKKQICFSVNPYDRTGSYLYDFKIIFLPTVSMTGSNNYVYSNPVLHEDKPNILISAKWHLSSNISNVKSSSSSEGLAYNNRLKQIYVKADNTHNRSEWAQSNPRLFLGELFPTVDLPTFDVSKIFNIIENELFLLKKFNKDDKSIKHSIAIGNNNDVLFNNSILIGHDLTSNNTKDNGYDTQPSVIMGRYNDQNINNTLLSIANGTSDIDRRNALDVLFKGSINTNGSLYQRRGICQGKLVNTDDAPVFDLEDGAVYELTVNGRLKSTGAYRGFTKWLIAAPFDPNGIGLTTTALAAPVSATLGSAGTAVVSGFNTNLRQEYTAYKPDGTEITAYHARLGIGSCTTDCWFQWSFVKVSGSVADFEEEWGE